MMKTPIRCVTLCGLFVAMGVSCAEKSPKPIASKPTAEAPARPEQPQEAAPPASQPTVKPPENQPKRPPKRPVDNWTIFREAFEAEEDAECKVEWLGGNKFRVDTKNISRITFNMTKLPEGAPAKGPWIIYLDGQGVELTGFRPKKGYTGRIRDLVRSKNGVWEVDKRKLYREGE